MPRLVETEQGSHARDKIQEGPHDTRIPIEAQRLCQQENQHESQGRAEDASPQAVRKMQSPRHQPHAGHKSNGKGKDTSKQSPDDVSPATAGTVAQLRSHPAAQQQHAASQDNACDQFQKRRAQRLFHRYVTLHCRHT